MINTAVKIQRDWISKSVAGVVLGLLLGLGCSALFMELAPDMMANIKVQLAMWMVTPIWLGVLSMSFLFQDGKRAWMWLVLANTLVFTLYFLKQQF